MEKVSKNSVSVNLKTQGDDLLPEIDHVYSVFTSKYLVLCSSALLLLDLHLSEFSKNPSWFNNVAQVKTARKH